MVGEPEPEAKTAVLEPCEEVYREVIKYDWNIDIAMAVAKAESNCRKDALGDTNITYWNNGREYGYSVGVFQIRILEGREACDTYDLAKNVECAYKVYSGRKSFTPWSVFTNGRYLKYL